MGSNFFAEQSRQEGQFAAERLSSIRGMIASQLGEESSHLVDVAVMLMPDPRYNIEENIAAASVAAARTIQAAIQQEIELALRREGK